MLIRNVLLSHIMPLSAGAWHCAPAWYSTAIGGRTALFSFDVAASVETVASPLRGLTAEQRIEDLPPLAPGARRVWLLRHGETDWNARGLMQGGGFDVELNDAGEAQAAAAAALLARILVDPSRVAVVASSRLARASRTADVLRDAAVPDAARFATTDLGEMRFGDLEGTARRGPESTEASRERYRAIHEELRRDPDARWPGANGESTNEVAARATRAVAEITARVSNGHDSAIVVAHGRTNKVLLATLLLGDPCRYDEIAQSNTCINVFDVETDESEGTARYVPRLINYQDHVTNKR